MKVNAAKLVKSVFEISNDIRYVAIRRHGELYSEQASNLVGASAGESDKYEEHLVNPAILTLAGNRGALDCGGMSYVLIRYGNFYQLVFPIAGGHASVCLDAKSDPLQYQTKIAEIFG